MKKAFKIAYIVLFFTLLCLPMLLMPFFKNDSTLEKRSLAKLPSYLEDGRLNLDFSDQFESYASDHFPLRAELLTASNTIKGELLHAQSSNVIVGRDGWLFFNSEQADFLNTNALTDRQIRSIAVTLSLIEEDITGRGGRFAFVPVPNKSTVYGEKMPPTFRRSSENNLTRLTEELTRSGVSFTDLRGILLASKDQTIYHRRDSHWNYRGALIGWGAVMDTLGKEHETYAGAAYTVENIWRGDLDKLLLPAGGVMDEQVVYQIDHDSFRFTYSMGVSDQAAQLANYMSDREERDDLFTAQNLDHKDGSRLYMVRDSFGRALLPFMIDSYETSTFKRTDCPNVASIEDGTDLIYEIAERNLHRIIETAPFLYAPLREGISADGLPIGGEIEGHTETTGYGTRLYGSLPDDLPAGDCRVYLVLEQDGGTVTLEAFPIHEARLLGDGGKNGYSAILSEELGLSGTYRVTVIAEGTAFPCGTFTAGTE
ncbi:MAG: hypothetical protein IK132_10285 [Clostridia bacterium]|nr:hypothetical protein [Clostridia bacterium]